MNKEEFMKTLEQSLENMDSYEKKDILYDYEEHFRIGFEKGKTAEEIIKELGDPKTIGKSYRASAAVEDAMENPSTKNIRKAILAALALGFFNLVIVLGPFLALAAVLISLFASAVAVFAAGIASIFAVLFHPFLGSIVAILGNPIAIFLLGIGTTALGILFFIGVCYLSKFFYRASIKYLKWNINIITKQ
ncbi:hypothetical protein Ccar_14525 [Clostridium carboxidivorans P7]|uniref:DUF1700 domain-containing protein n=1 Tax=Clostridium carboxidivorans P7 TaxID=536227 RepID=C6PYQ2_9CLOT|nr:DUF1700 domain-containing protein [Clostridium carboxidivorans]AKN32012.1 hypothetical protein Ccar_14525 [Clostridium carboxidivorans P7]EET85633.1 protein of unknown function DUF1700 [Clostridium carboxidivorans P7]EFG87850.1 hypothetical protein CLCAR_2451 [Clostridium carboxidivorans P7]